MQQNDYIVSGAQRQTTRYLQSELTKPIHYKIINFKRKLSDRCKTSLLHR